MSGEHPYRLGYQYGLIFKAFDEATKRMAQGFTDAVQGVRHNAPPLTEMGAKIRYRQRIEHERQIGLAFVKAEAARVRKELGL